MQGGLSVTDIKNTPYPLKDYITEVTRLRERTSSGPSDVTPAMIKSEVLDSDLAEINWRLSNFSWVTGTAPKRWLQGLDLLIHKSKNDDRTSKLRPILLFDIECNMHNKRLGRHAMKQAESLGAVAPEQYGSRKRLAADTQALNTRLFYDLVNLERSPAVACFADLVSNYDLVAHNIASICLQRVNTPKAPTFCTFTVLQDMVHSCRTAFGDSTKTYGGDIWAIPLKPPPQGLGQGSGNAAQTWALVSTPILNSLREAGLGAAFKCCISEETFHLVGYAFVDDCTLVSLAPSPDWTTKQTMDMAQEGMDLYAGSAKATGGKVHPDKTSWYLVEFQWTKAGTWRYVHNNEAALSVETPRGRRNINRLPVTQASRILGVWLAPDGNSKRQVDESRKKSLEWASRVNTGHINKSDAWFYFQTTIKKSLEFPLTATTMSPEDCRRIEAPALGAALHAAGLPNNMPREIIYGPEKFLGLAHGSLFHTQGLRRIQAIMDHGLSQTTTGKQIRACIERHKLEVGCSGPLFSTDFQSHGSTTTKTTWIFHAWKYMWDNKMTLAESTPHLLPQRDNDVFIMEQLARAGHTPKQLSELNRCRLYLQVTTHSDISSGDGTSITMTKMDNTLNIHFL